MSVSCATKIVPSFYVLAISQIIRLQLVICGVLLFSVNHHLRSCT